MKKHGIILADIEGEEIKFHHFKVLREYKKLFCQVAATVIGAKYDLYKHKKRQYYYSLNVSASDAIEISAKYDFYLKAYKEQLELFYGAFIIKNNLYPKTSEDEQFDWDDLDALYMEWEELVEQANDIIYSLK